MGSSEGYSLSADVIFTRGDNSAILVDDTLVQISTAPDGRPVYFPTDKEPAGCEADPLQGGRFACDRLFDNDFILSNVQGDDVEQTSISLTLSKAFDWGLEVMVGYAYTESEDVNPMTSSTAGSNYFNVAVADSNNPGLATSNYEIPHRIVLKLAFERAFFGEYATRFTLYGSANEGRPFSYTFDDQEMFRQGSFTTLSDDRSLLYMPAGTSDSLVVYQPAVLAGDIDPITGEVPTDSNGVPISIAAFDQSAFFAYAAANGIPECGCILPRNGFNSDWWNKFDLKISQDLPGFGSEHRVQAYFIVENFGNLLSDDWGVLYEQRFPRAADIVQASFLDTAGTPDDFSDDQYLFEEFFELNQSRATSTSLWSARVGVTYRF